MTRLFTIGGYGHSAQSFIALLHANEIDLFVDIRQRRGMHGSSHAFLNAKQLEDSLGQAGITYLHLKDLAPNDHVRAVQRAADTTASVAKGDRACLSPAFIEAYRKHILQGLDPSGIFACFEGFERVCLFCVEKGHLACHRSVLTDWLEPMAGANLHL